MAGDGDKRVNIVQYLERLAAARIPQLIRTILQTIGWKYLGDTRQYCRLNICSYIVWIDKYKYSICKFNQYNYKYWDDSAV